ncbi:MAG: DUF2828 family protein [Oribacterium sp.]|nr:DUF2828 family protein [Oribacterium sp.]MDY6317192.1 DUF2828 family protein [Oribacterium sp.]
MGIHGERIRANILENRLREKDYTFDYEKQPSKVLFKYRAAFDRNNADRYEAFINKVSSSEAHMNTGTLMPYDIIAPIANASIGRAAEISETERKTLNTTWNAQENFAGDENALVVVDGSGSMYWDVTPMPASVARSLAIYFAERNKGIFKNHFITFSTNPRLVEIKGRDIVDKVQYCETFNECSNTDIMPATMQTSILIAEITKIMTMHMKRHMKILRTTRIIKEND